MSQLVEKLEKEREDHVKTIKQLTLTELREKVRAKSHWLDCALIESKKLRSKAEIQRGTPGRVQIQKILERLRNWELVLHGATDYETENPWSVDDVQSAATCQGIRKIL